MRVHISWVLIVLLVTATLATALLPTWQPQWSSPMRWGVALLQAMNQPPQAQHAPSSIELLFQRDTVVGDSDHP